MTLLASLHCCHSNYSASNCYSSCSNDVDDDDDDDEADDCAPRLLPLTLLYCDADAPVSCYIMFQVPYKPTSLVSWFTAPRFLSIAFDYCTNYCKRICFKFVHQSAVSAVEMQTQLKFQVSK